MELFSEVTNSKYRDAFKELLASDYGLTDITETECVAALPLDYQTGSGEERSYSSIFVTEKTERKIEDFVKTDQLGVEEIEKLDPPSGCRCFSVSAKGSSRAIR